VAERLRRLPEGSFFFESRSDASPVRNILDKSREINPLRESLSLAQFGGAVKSSVLFSVGGSNPSGRVVSLTAL